MLERYVRSGFGLKSAWSFLPMRPGVLGKRLPDNSYGWPPMESRTHSGTVSFDSSSLIGEQFIGLQFEPHLLEFVKSYSVSETNKF